MSETMNDHIRHVLVVFDHSAAAARALLDAAAIAEEHGAEISVISTVPHDPGRRGCATCGVSRSHWNAMLTELAESELATARAILGERLPATRFGVVSGVDGGTLRRTVSELGCDLLVLPERGRFRRRGARRRVARLRRRLAVDVLEVRAT
jgi:nucleotide-binding universal stress UspA family protein